MSGPLSSASSINRVSPPSSSSSPSGQLRSLNANGSVSSSTSASTPSKAQISTSTFSLSSLVPKTFSSTHSLPPGPVPPPSAPATSNISFPSLIPSANSSSSSSSIPGQRHARAPSAPFLSGYSATTAAGLPDHRGRRPGHAPPGMAGPNLSSNATSPGMVSMAPAPGSSHPPTLPTSSASSSSSPFKEDPSKADAMNAFDMNLTVGGSGNGKAPSLTTPSSIPGKGVKGEGEGAKAVTLHKKSPSSSTSAQSTWRRPNNSSATTLPISGSTTPSDPSSAAAGVLHSRTGSNTGAAGAKVMENWRQPPGLPSGDSSAFSAMTEGKDRTRRRSATVSATTLTTSAAKAVTDLPPGFEEVPSSSIPTTATNGTTKEISSKAVTLMERRKPRDLILPSRRATITSTSGSSDSVVDGASEQGATGSSHSIPQAPQHFHSQPKAPPTDGTSKEGEDFAFMRARRSKSVHMVDVGKLGLAKPGGGGGPVQPGQALPPPPPGMPLAGRNSSSVGSIPPGSIKLFQQLEHGASGKKGGVQVGNDGDVSLVLDGEVKGPGESSKGPLKEESLTSSISRHLWTEANDGGSRDEEREEGRLANSLSSLSMINGGGHPLTEGEDSMPPSLLRTLLAKSGNGDRPGGGERPMGVGGMLGGDGVRGPGFSQSIGIPSIHCTDPSISQPGLSTRMTGTTSPPLSSLLGISETMSGPGSHLGMTEPMNGPPGPPMSKVDSFPADSHYFPLHQPLSLPPSLSPYGPSPSHPVSSFPRGREAEEGMVKPGERMMRPEDGGMYGPLGQGYPYPPQHLPPGQHLPPHALPPHSLSPPHPSHQLPTHALSPPHPSHMHPSSHHGLHGPPPPPPSLPQNSGGMFGAGMSPALPHGPGMPPPPHSPHHHQAMQGNPVNGGGGGGTNGPIRDIPLSVQADDFVGFGLARGLPAEVILQQAGPVANLPLDEVVASLRRAHLHGVVGGGGAGRGEGFSMHPPGPHPPPPPGPPPHSMADHGPHPGGMMPFHARGSGPMPPGSSYPHPPPPTAGYPPISSPFSHPTSPGHGMDERGERVGGPHGYGPGGYFHE
ncbi:hypothetical protein BJ684DRAFT_16022 [Piptocephalis cylindrospora]|uniref:Uncharacterized protein n=1 Tax=Piptocephalis cylindrospora TaxID=1907219 RepID=A0A4P9Y429_9FUNG|nr:hypothetical protein BJ684DRAFT_16022 [Piptocephalis cylindrospora]|eukprot:RKP13593.1 hypothetical protein BJ684DRAFT_16022 [Piptocephalis cylindrospora]